MLDIFIPCLMLGVIAGLLSGLLGIGGGSVLVPALLWLFETYHVESDRLMLMAIATSLASIVLTSMASILAHHKLGAILWPLVLRWMPAIMLGSVLGAIIADAMPTAVLKIIFASFLLLISVQMAFALKPNQKPDQEASHLSSPLLAFAGTVMGGLSAILGIGGGSMMVPFLVAFQLPIRNAIAVSSACGLPIAVASSVSYMFLGFKQSELPEWSLGYIYLPALMGIVVCSTLFAPVGAGWAHRIPVDTLKRGFSLFLFLVGIKLFYGAVG